MDPRRIKKIKIDDKILYYVSFKENFDRYDDFSTFMIEFPPLKSTLTNKNRYC